MNRRAAVLMSLALSLPMIAGAASPQKAGKWQQTMQMEMPGIPVRIPPVTVTVCLSEEDVADPQKALPKDPKSECKVSDYKVDGNTVTWKTDCPKQGMKGTGTITYEGDAYSGQMDMSAGEQTMKMKYSGKYLGACDKK
jgi:hypothetical protein